MSAFPEQLTEALSLPTPSLSPQNVASNNSTPTTVGSIDMSKFRRAIAFVSTGVLSATNTLIQFEASANAANSFSNVSGGPTIVVANNTWDGTLEIRADQMPANTRYLRLSLLTTGGVNTGHFLSAFLVGGCSAYKPAKQYDGSNNGSYTLSRQVA